MESPLIGEVGVVVGVVVDGVVVVGVVVVGFGVGVVGTGFLHACTRVSAQYSLQKFV